MLKDIIKKEILETITSAKFVFTFLLCAILILLSVFTGISNYRSDAKEYTAALALNKKNLESQPSYQALAGLGTKINKSPQVLGAIASGVDEAVGRVATVNIAYDPNLVDSKYESNPIFSVFGALDLTFIVKIVLSLFAILFTYDAIVGEKERGTLKLTLSNRVPRDRLILGKVIGGFISLLIPLIIPLVLSMLMLLVFPNISMNGEYWGRLLLMFLMYFLYLSVFFTLGLFVSARTSRSSTSFLVLLFIWVIFVTVIPKLSVMTAAQIKPIPSVHEITAKKDAFLQQIQGSAQKEVLDWVKENAQKPGEDPKAFQDQFKKYLEDFQQDGDHEDRREQRRPGAGLPAPQGGPAEPGRQPVPDLAGLGPDVLDDEPGPHRDRRAREVPRLDPGLQAPLDQVGQLEDDAEPRFLRDGPERQGRPGRHARPHVRARDAGQVFRPDPARFRPHGRPDPRLFRRGLCLLPEVRRPLRGSS